MTNPSFSTFSAQGSDTGALDTLIRKSLSELGTNTLVQVTAVHPGDGIVGTVDVQPMVHQQTSDGTAVPHGVIYGVPYLRIQGGACAVIVDPAVSDIGYVIISGRDQSNAVANRVPSAPGSFRQHSMADCVYVGGFLGAAPTHYVQITTDGIRLVTTGKVTVEASEMDIDCPLKVNGPITATGDVIGNGISLDNHEHGGVQAGSSVTGKAQ
ncbi:baseplate assembly protein [Gluconobacter frateurii]|uniref:Gp138 family membrane-puncturing spike protein n=1 Tax=Gluconobacter frateurii TaxID=38308 RepID=UPI001F05384A|nr:Gp138 family membrane-puncturing spike protein [Gluconobacter frateurii]UMM08411.1 baseplate assembly protein [Gluconobacter frateurii]